MWFSVVYSLIDNDHHSGQNVVDSRGAAAIGAPPCSSLRSCHTTVMIMYVFAGDESQ